ncbi:hypothetical protein M427DRAFT_467512 [Gonapodya prolifera JEL478]|uniref:Uncharacterized protein n=1 Tax=Gonapodya prolifera (strain JEL478) TaxID=1344416 RepID=A0A139A1J0_GONPJ|nr:hypothetical protein M427DRAFT_467512 [Gonapodya prolifera JEL478]|eukprot:KXS10622.1 hypothetical protein M427DRAFT_467512 [Gonapodya prolifera JEL478]
MACELLSLCGHSISFRRQLRRSSNGVAPGIYRLKYHFRLMDKQVLHALLRYRPDASNPTVRSNISRWQLQQGCSIALNKNRPDLLLPLLTYLNNYYSSIPNDQHQSGLPINVTKEGSRGLAKI